MPRVLEVAEHSARKDGRDLRSTGIHPDYWYPLARSNSLKKGKALGVAFAGEPVVLVRGESGEVFALEDRCAHRQVPLHAGVVSGECIRCCYHGWSYDRTGRCIDVPALGRSALLPRGVRAYPCREAYGFIFVFPGNAEKAASRFPEIPSHADAAYKTRTLTGEVRCHYSFMHENLMDMSHQFLHRRLMGSIKTIPVAFRKGEDWLEADYRFKRIGGRQPLGEAFILNRARAAPEDSARDLMTVSTRYPYQTLKVWAGREEPLLDVWITYVPVDRAQRINRTFGLLMIRRPRVPGVIHVLWPAIVWFTEQIFAEDRAIVEHEQRAYEAQGADWNQEISPVIRELKALLMRCGVDRSR